MSQTYTSSETYSVTDVEVVVRRVKADLIMIASSTGAVSEETAKEWAHDVEILAKNGYLKMVDLTLFSNDVEYMATQFKVNTESGELTTSRPGAMWPRLPNPYLRIVLSYTAAYDAAAKEKMRDRLMIGWTPTNADTSHSTLTSDSGRDYVSNGYGMQRKDFSR
ncbi:MULTISPECIES: hypothetical protein [Pseudomonas]|jgi:hypothetical protein|uniref:HORMA-1 domain-containing protein n=1 Tax=Pseudomonas TaxID=286 RepID=UPI001C996CFF|nr:hypothetical protein [Pseudomonas sp. DR48]QZP30492.1 hypothetical protein K5K95_20085 [Pseudomonas sp. DR48]